MQLCLAADGNSIPIVKQNFFHGEFSCQGFFDN